MTRVRDIGHELPDLFAGRWAPVCLAVEVGRADTREKLFQRVGGGSRRLYNKATSLHGQLHVTVSL
jgi:hypothetical protein